MVQSGLISAKINDLGFEATATLGKIDIKIAGDISINVASF